MPISIVRLGTPRARNEGPRLGTVRRPPRGVKKTDYARLNFYDVWLPKLSPSEPLVKSAFSEPFTPKRWAAFARRYRREMQAPETQRLLALLAALSAQTNFSVGCYRADEAHCHRSLLRELLVDAGATIR